MQKKSILLGLFALGILLLLLINSKKEFKIEDYAYVPPEHLEEYLQLQASLPDGEFLTKFTPAYVSTDTPADENLQNVNCPIPMQDRVKNHTGSQCVWSSIEMLGRWAEEPKLTNPPLTSRGKCRTYSSPSLAARVLTELNVKFEQTYRDRAAGVAMIKKAMAQGRGCLFDVPGHAMVLIHYDEAKDVAKYIDNSDYSLRIHTTTINGFNRRWGSWILVIYADNDIIPVKLNRSLWSRKLPIFDRNNPQRRYPKDYVPIPRRPDIFNIPE